MGDRTKRLVPTRVGTDTDWARISPGAEHTCAVRTDRSLWCWGRNLEGELGLVRFSEDLPDGTFSATG